jgi:hypothetical protein
MLATAMLAGAVDLEHCLDRSAFSGHPGVFVCHSPVPFSVAPRLMSFLKSKTLRTLYQGFEAVGMTEVRSAHNPLATMPDLTGKGKSGTWQVVLGPSGSRLDLCPCFVAASASRETR